MAPLRLAAPSTARFVLVTATLPAPLYEHLQLEFPGIVPALGPGLHRSAPGESQRLGFAETTDAAAVPRHHAGPGARPARQDGRSQTAAATAFQRFARFGTLNPKS